MTHLDAGLLLFGSCAVGDFFPVFAERVVTLDALLAVGAAKVAFSMHFLPWDFAVFVVAVREMEKGIMLFNESKLHL